MYFVLKLISENVLSDLSELDMYAINTTDVENVLEKMSTKHILYQEIYDMDNVPELDRVTNVKMQMGPAKNVEEAEEAYNEAIDDEDWDGNFDLEDYDIDVTMVVTFLSNGDDKMIGSKPKSEDRDANELLRMIGGKF